MKTLIFISLISISILTGCSKKVPALEQKEKPSTSTGLPSPDFNPGSSPFIGTQLEKYKIQNTNINQNKVQKDQSRAEIVRILGDPLAEVEQGRKLFLVYAGNQKIELINDRVTYVPPSFQKKIAIATQEREEKIKYHKAQIKKGLVLHYGKWIPVKKRDAMLQKEVERFKKQNQKPINKKSTVDLNLPTQYRSIRKQDGRLYTIEDETFPRNYIVHREDGSVVDHKPFAIPGKVAIVEFRLKGASTCSIVDNEIRRFVRSDKYIEFKSIKFESWEDLLVDKWVLNKKWKTTIRVVDSEGRVMGVSTYSIKVLADHVDRAKRQTNIMKKLSIE